MNSRTGLVRAMPGCQTKVQVNGSLRQYKAVQPTGVLSLEHPGPIIEKGREYGRLSEVEKRESSAVRNLLVVGE